METGNYHLHATVLMDSLMKDVKIISAIQLIVLTIVVVLMDVVYVTMVMSMKIIYVEKHVLKNHVRN